MIGFTLAIFLALAGQVLLSQRSLWGLAFYAPAVVLFLTTLRRNVWVAGFPGERAGDESGVPERAGRSRPWRVTLLVSGLASAVIAFVGASGNTYRGYGVVAWLLSVGLFLSAFWERGDHRIQRSFWRRLGLGRDVRRLSWMALIVAGLILVGVGFRFWRLDALPPEMNIDHVANLSDVHRLSLGARPIFFARNNGREPWLFYWTLLVTRLLGLEIKFYALKLSIAIVSLSALPAVYLFGKELFGHWVGLWAAFFTAVASWPVLLSRIGLRSVLTPAVTAWSLLFLFRGLRRGRRNDFLLLGVSLGVGLHGYTAFRAMPLAVVVVWVLCIRNSGFVNRDSGLFRNALLTIVVAVLVFLPLGRYSLEQPDAFWYRSFSRVSDPDRPYQHSILVTLLINLASLGAMFHWEGDVVWVAHWQRLAPVLDPVLGAFLSLGLVMVLWRVLGWRDVWSLSLLVAGVLLLSPSMLSLAFPSENPSVMRTSGAIPVVMTMAALPLGLWLKAAWDRSAGRRRAAIGGAALAVAVAIVLLNWQMIFVDYSEQYDAYTTNTTEIAAAIQGFVDGGGDLENAFVVKGYPYWIDTDGVGIELGHFGWANDVIETEHADAHVGQPRPRFYVLRADHVEEMSYLQTLFPDGQATPYPSRYPGEDLVTFYVPPQR